MNTRKAEHLTIDPPLTMDMSGKKDFTQKYFVASFVSPTDRIKQRFFYDANRFLYHDVNKQLMDTTANLARTLNTSYRNQIEKQISHYQSSKNDTHKEIAHILSNLLKEMPLDEDEQVNQTLRCYRIDQQELNDRFDLYKTQNDKELESGFNQEFTDQTSVFGFKVRNGFEDEKEAKAYANRVRQEIEPFVHTFIGPMGYWVPFDPNADAVQDQEYMVPELNQLMSKTKENAQQRDEFYSKRKQQMMDDATHGHDKELKERLKNRIKEQESHRQKK